MRRILLTLLFAFAPLVHAGIGDVYYCAWQKTGLVDPENQDDSGLGTAGGLFTLKWKEAEIIIKYEDGEQVKPVVSSDEESFTSLTTRPDGHEYWNYRDASLQYIWSVNGGEKSLVRVSFASCEKFD